MGRKSAFELKRVSVRLVPETPLYSDTSIRSPKDAVHVVGDTLREMDREVICVVNLRSDGRPVNCTFASVGAVNYAMGHPRELLKASILSNAVSIIMVHNHPSGSLLPSKDDVRMTDRMQKLCELMGIPLQDHIIVGGDNRVYFSFKEKGIIKENQPCYQSNYHYLEWGEDRSVAR